MTKPTTKTTITNVTKEKKKKNSSSNSKKKNSNNNNNNNPSRRRIDPISMFKPARTEEQYLRALINPFDPMVEGVRVPDRFPFPTVVYHSKNSATISSDSGGNVSFFYFPSATNTFMYNNGSSVTTDFGYNQGMSTFNSSGVLSDVNFSALFDSCRIVAGGMLIANDMTFSNVTGRITCVPFIGPDLSISNAEMVLGSVSGANVANLLSNQCGTSLSCPGSFQINADQLIDNEILLTTRPITPAGYTFKSVNGQGDGLGGNVASMVGNEYFSTVTGLVTQGAMYLGSNTKDLVGWRISGNGFPVSTPVLNLQFVGHFEGQFTASTSTLIPSGIKKNSPVSNIETLLTRLPAEMARICAPSLATGIAALGEGLLRGLLK